MKYFSLFFIVLFFSCDSKQTTDGLNANIAKLDGLVTKVRDNERDFKVKIDSLILKNQELSDSLIVLRTNTQEINSNLLVLSENHRKLKRKNKRKFEVLDDSLVSSNSRITLNKTDLVKNTTRIDTNKIGLEFNTASITNNKSNLTKIENKVDFEKLPIGTIVPYNGHKLPNGWHLCDGNKGTPNLQGYFIRGVDSKYSLGVAGGTDKIKDHKHSIPQLTASLPDYTGKLNYNFNIKTKKIAHSTPVDGESSIRVIYDNSDGELKNKFKINNKSITSKPSKRLLKTNPSNANLKGEHDNKPRFKAFYYIMKIRNYK